VRRYEAEGDGPHLIDLSHRPRWDLQGSGLDRIEPLGRAIPKAPGACHFSDPLLINRMNRTQAAIWQLTGGPLVMPENSGSTDVTDATVFLALIGETLFSITEQLTALDLGDPSRTPPFLLQGPFARVACQIVVMTATDGVPGILMTCARGYSRDMTAAILDAGAFLHLRPAGEAAFESWLKTFPLKSL
jgi:hypothetical protein